MFGPAAEVVARGEISRRSVFRSAWGLTVGLAVASVTVAGCGARDVSGAAAPIQPHHSWLRRYVRLTGDLDDAQMTSVADTAQRAAVAVRNLWGPGRLWAGHGRASVNAVATHAEFVRRGGDSSELVAATTTTAGVVLISREALDALTPAGVEAVLAHELTHSRLGIPGGVPRWLLEGPAEFTAWQHTGLALAAYAPSLRTRVRAGQLPTGPPPDSEFTVNRGANGLRAAYQDALAWCAFLEGRGGRGRFVATVEGALTRGAGATGHLREVYGAQEALGVSYRRWLQREMNRNN